MSKKHKLRKLKITKKAAIIVSLLILTGLAGWFIPIFIHNYSRFVEEAKQKEFDTKRLDIQNTQAFGGNPDEAIKKVDDALKDPSLTDDQRYDLYADRGNIPFEEGDYIAAIGYLEKAESIKQDLEIVDLLARAWEGAGNKEKAIGYYKKAIELMPESPLRDENIEDMQKAIRRLGGTP